MNALIITFTGLLGVCVGFIGGISAGQHYSASSVQVAAATTRTFSVNGTQYHVSRIVPMPDLTKVSK